MIVKDFMTSNVITCSPTNSVQDAANIMADKGFSIIPIVSDDNQLLGVLTESDFVGKEVNVPHALVSLKQLFGKTYHLNEIEKVYQDVKLTALEKVMTKKVRTVKPESTLSSVVDTMVSYHLKRLPVLEDGKLVGIITRKDLLKAFNRINQE
jgi:CBS domain-containing protein